MNSFRRSITKIAAVCAIVISLLVIAGWLLDIQFLKSMLAGNATMKFNAAICVLCTSVALLLLQKESINGLKRKIASVLLFIPVLICSLTLFQYFSGWNLGIDELVVKEKVLGLGTKEPGRMSSLACFSFLSLALALICIQYQKSRVIVQGALFFSMLFSVSALISLIFGISLIHSMPSLARIALPAAASIVLLSTGILYFPGNRYFNFSFNEKLTGGFSLIILVLIIIFVAFRDNNRNVVDTSRLMEHAKDVLFQSEQLLSEVKDVESGTRGYVISGNESFLEPSQKTAGTIPTHINRLKELRSDNPLLKLRIEALEKLINAKIARSEQMVLERKSGHAEKAMELVSTTRGKLLMDAIRNEIREIQEGEQRILNLRKSENQGSINNSGRMIIFFQIAVISTLIILLIVIVKNFEARRRAEKSLAESKEWFAKTLSSIGDGVIATDTRGIISLMNKAAASLSGWAPEEAIGQHIDTVFDICNETTGQKVINPAVEALQQNKTILLANHTILKRKDGGAIPIDDSGAPIHNEAGQTIGAVLVFRDVTEKKKAEEALKSSNKRFTTIFDFSPIALSITSVNDGRFKYVNDAFCQTTGYKREQLIGKKSVELSMIGAAEREKVIQQIHNAGGHGRDIEIKIRRSNGEMIDIFYSVERIEIDDEACFAAALVDITERKKTEAEIIAAQKRFTTIFNVSPVAIALTTIEDGRFKFVNDAFCDMTGYNRKEIIGKKSIEVNILNAEDREETMHQVLRGGGRGKDIESSIRKTTGEIIDVLFSVERIEIDNEMCFAYAWVDISERKKAESQIRILNDTLEKRVNEKTREIVEKEKQYRFLLENMREGIQVIGFDWRYLFVNRSVLQQVKYSNEELLGHTMMERYPGIENTELFQVLQRCMRERTSQIFENEFTFPDGTKNCFELSIQPVPEGLFILSMDITERKKAEQAIVASEETRRLIMNAAQDAIVCIDSSSLVTVWTPQAEKTFGWTEQEVIGKNISSIIIPPQYREAHKNGMANYLHTGQGPVLNKLIEITAINKAGTTFPVELSIVPFYQNSKTFFCGFIRDITQRKKAQEEIQQLNDSLEQKVIERTAQLEASNKELDSFSYSVSHDLRAPLRAIDGYARILQEDYGDKIDREGRRIMKVIMNNAQKMGQLIDDLLAFSHLGKQHIVKVDIDMNTLVHSIVDKLISEENKKSIEFDIKPLLNAGGDSSMVRQVMINLISNAVKYSGKKEKPVIEIGSYKENGSINYYVKDNGAGFDARYTDKLFNVFQRLHGANEFEGTGVGLAIVHRIITRHGGKVWAEGKVNEGAVFYFSLPDSGLLNN